MINRALRAIEEVYEMSLNPTLDYQEQLAPLAPSGELADKVKLTKLVFKICGLLDKQAEEIAKLKADREQIASEMVKLRTDSTPQTTKPIEVDPTQPI